MAGLAKMADERPATCAAVLFGEAQGNGLAGNRPGELAATKDVGGLILLTPFYSGYRFAKFHAKTWSRRCGWLGGRIRGLRLSPVGVG